MNKSKEHSAHSQSSKAILDGNDERTVTIGAIVVGLLFSILPIFGYLISNGLRLPTEQDASWGRVLVTFILFLALPCFALAGFRWLYYSDPARASTMAAIRSRYEAWRIRQMAVGLGIAERQPGDKPIVDRPRDEDPARLAEASQEARAEPPSEELETFRRRESISALSAVGIGLIACVLLASVGTLLSALNYPAQDNSTGLVVLTVLGLLGIVFFLGGRRMTQEEESGDSEPENEERNESSHHHRRDRSHRPSAGQPSRGRRV